MRILDGLALASLIIANAATVNAADSCAEGAAAVQRRDMSAAESLLKQCIATQPAQLEAYLMLAGVYQSQKNADALYLLAVSGVAKFPQEKRFYLTAATHEARVQRYEAAIDRLEEAYRRWPADPAVRSLLANSHFARGSELLDASKNEVAARHLHKAVELAPEDVEAHLNLGRAQHNLLRNSEALETFNHVLELKPGVTLAHFHRGLTLYALGEFERAIQDLNKEIETNPEYAPARFVRGLSFMANGEWEKAGADLDAAAERMPDNAQAHFARARALVQAGKLSEAEVALRKAIALDATDPGPANTLVSVLLRLGRADEARALAQKAAELARQRRSAEPGEIRFQSFKRPIR